MTNATRACDRCGADISALHRSARRCPTCPKRQMLGPIPDRSCEICGTIYTPKRRDSVCCSRACNGLRYNRLYAARQKDVEPERTCPGCETTFKAWRTDQKYCSPRLRESAPCAARHRVRRPDAPPMRAVWHRLHAQAVHLRLLLPPLQSARVLRAPPREAHRGSSGLGSRQPGTAGGYRRAVQSRATGMGEAQPRQRRHSAA